ncbi:UNVERIFIED_ORG: histidine kinase [Zoogloea ramigera]|uniref:Sensor histidine kinase n=1 Tax=Duganella zoogloeoides TaxID=75659 RepID=A0ABZ0XXT7_9BURK|nr:histidine kinase [Duganella zoogloeoides]WQH04576.1 sensor histidine kinase [Duganella zoogloeoides]
MTPSFTTAIPIIVHDPRLVWRYHLQTLLRLLPAFAPAMVILPVLFGPWLWLDCLLVVLVSTSTSWRYLHELRDAGIALTPQMISARPRLAIKSPLDPLTTFDACAETLSGLALGRALGYPGPAAFSYRPFKGRIMLAPPRSMFLWRRTEVVVSGEPGQVIDIEIRGRFGLDFFHVQRGEAWQVVQVVADHLRIELKRRHDIAQLRKRERDLERAALHAKLAALQAQVEPHFLFNTLANLKYLVRTDSALAQQMLDHLVGYLHNAMPDMRRVSSTLGRELALAGDYLAIMRIRMGERLSFRIEADDAARVLPFPPAMLISLVENAIKHGLESATRPGELVIRATLDDGALRVTVADNGAGLCDEPGQGVGLANIHERLQLLYGARASLTVLAPQAGGVQATLVVPVVPQEAA